jgi:hypothetical protein
MSWVDNRVDIGEEATMLVFVLSIGQHIGLIHSTFLGGKVQLFLFSSPGQVCEVAFLANNGDRPSC